MLTFVRTLIALLILGGAVTLGYFVANQDKDMPKDVAKVVKTVFVEEAVNTTVPIIIPANGNLQAKNRLELYAEVQGVFKSSDHDFKVGQPYQKGETLLNLDAAEYYASVQAAKSELYNLITSIMPDLRLDYASYYEKWQNYLTSFDLGRSTPSLPQPHSDQEKYFISGRGIYSAYYNVKNMEERLSKYRLKAPFTGILTEASVNTGTLVRPGQKLGEFIDTSVYELEVSIAKKYSDLLALGELVNLSAREGTQKYTGKVVRINGKVDQATQTIKVFIELNGSPTLKEGMFLQALLAAKEESNAMSIPRQLLVDNSKIYVVKDSVLDLIAINPVYFSDKEVVIKGIPEGTIFLAKPVPGAYSGMRVKVYQEERLKDQTE